MASQLLWSAPARSAGTVVRRLRPVASKAVVNNHSPAAKLASIENPVAFISNPVAILPTSGGGPLRRSVEPTRTPMAPLLRIFSRGPREILNFCRRFGSGKPFLRISFVDHCSEATNSITNWLVLAPVPILSFAPINHAHKKAWRRSHGVQRNPAKGA